MPRRRRQARGCLADRVEARRKSYEAADLEDAIRMFFHAIDEDGSNKLEAHEFAVAQMVVAQLAGEDFDDSAFDNISNWDKTRSGDVTMKEFIPVMRDLCQALPGNRADLVEDIASKASEHINETRRLVGREIRDFFSALDSDETGTLSEDQVQKMAKLAMGLQQELKLEIDTKVPLEQFLSLEAFDKAKDGVVSLSEFIEHFLDFTKKVKLPKKVLVVKLKELAAEARGEWERASLGEVKAAVSGVDAVLSKYA